MTNIKDLLAKAKETGISEGGGGGRFRPANGDYVVKVIKANHDINERNGQPRIGVHLEIIDNGPDHGRKWWDNIMLGGSDKANALNFGKLKGLGADEEMVEKLGDIASIAAFLVDRTAKATAQRRSYVGNDGTPRDAVNTYFSRDVDSVDPSARVSAADADKAEREAAEAAGTEDTGEGVGRGW